MGNVYVRKECATCKYNDDTMRKGKACSKCLFYSKWKKSKKNKHKLRLI